MTESRCWDAEYARERIEKVWDTPTEKMDPFAKAYVDAHKGLEDATTALKALEAAWESKLAAAHEREGELYEKALELRAAHEKVVHRHRLC